MADEARHNQILAAPTMLELAWLKPSPSQDECVQWWERKGFKQLWREDGTVYMRQSDYGRETVSITAEGQMTLTRLSDFEWEGLQNCVAQHKREHADWPEKLEPPIQGSKST